MRGQEFCFTIIYYLYAPVMPSPPLGFTSFSFFLFLHPFTVSSGRAQGGPALAAFWARVREATGSSSGAAAAAAFFIAALDAFAARGKACGETCVQRGGLPPPLCSRHR